MAASVADTLAAMAKRRYTDADRETALAALAANGGNVSRTAEQLGIPRKTLQNWASGTHHPEAAENGHRKKGELAAALEEIAWKLAESIPGKIPSAPLAQTATALGIAIDKLRLLRGEPTDVREESVNLAARIGLYTAAFAEIADSPDAGDRTGDGAGEPLDPGLGAAKAQP